MMRQDYWSEIHPKNQKSYSVAHFCQNGSKGSNNFGGRKKLSMQVTLFSSVNSFGYDA
jgi:hypothetical protein